MTKKSFYKVTVGQKQRQLWRQAEPLKSQVENVHLRTFTNLWEKAFWSLLYSILHLPKYYDFFIVVFHMCTTPFSHIILIFCFTSNTDSHSKEIFYRSQRKIKEQRFKSHSILLSLVGSVIFKAMHTYGLSKVNPN